MSVRRTFDQHVELFVAFSHGVAHLSPDSWTRLCDRCAELDGPAFRALVNRASLAAKPYELWLPTSAQRSVPFRVIAGVSRAVQTSIAIAGQAAAEFETSAMPVPVPPRSRTARTGQATTDAFLDANFRIESALAPRERLHPGVATAVRAAGQAVLRHDWISSADFDAVYEHVEAEIPFAGLHPPRGTGGDR